MEKKVLKKINYLIILFSLLFLASCAQNVKFCAISDIHGAAENLKYFLQQCDLQQIDGIIIAGDIVEHFRNNISDYDELNQTLFLLSKQKQPVFILPGNHENQADYTELIDYYKAINPKITDLAAQNNIVFYGITILGLPGYENQQFLTENGFLLENQKIKSIIDEARQKDGNKNKNNNNKNNNKNNILLVSHGPPKGKNSWSIDALADGTNVGNIFLDQIMKQKEIMFSISGHIHEAGQKAVNEDDGLVAEDKWSNSLRLNAGSVVPWKMNTGDYSVGSVAIMEIRGEEARYSIIRR